MGNFISKLFGASKPETVTEKYARQDAEFRAKHPERFQPPAPQPQPAPAGVGGVKGLMGGSLTTNLQEREKAAGLKVGGMVRKKCVEGGEIEGPGGPTDDLVPIDASNGEFMIKASSAKILGEDVLEALNDLGDEPKDPKMDAAEDASEDMKCGGMVRKKKMAMGGPVEMPMNTDPMNMQDQQAFNSLQNTATGVAPTTPAPTTTTQTVQQPPKQLRASTTAALNSYTPLPIPQLKAGGMVRGKPVLKMAEAGSVDEARKKAEAVASAPLDAQAATDRQAISGAWNTVKDVNQRAGAAIADVATLVPRGLAGAYDSAVIRPMRAAGINAGYMSPLVSPAGADPASMTPFYDQIRAKDAATPAAKVSQVTPASAGATPTPGATLSPSVSQVTRQQRQGDPSSPDLKDEFSNAMIENRNPGGMVRKVGNSYSGSNITGDVSFQGADGNALPGRPKGGFMVANGMSPEAIKSALTNPDGSAWSAGDNAIMAANMRDGVDKYRGTSRDPRNDPMNQPMTKDQRAARVRMAETASQDKRYAQANATEQEKLGMLRSEFTAKQTKDKQVTDLQNAYMNAKTPEEKDTYRQKMIALGLIKTNAPTYHPGSKVTDALGNQTITEGTVFNPDTQEVRVVGQQAKAVVPDAATARTQALAALKANPANKDEINKRLAAAGYQPI